MVDESKVVATVTVKLTRWMIDCIDSFDDYSRVHDQVYDALREQGFLNTDT